MLDEPVINTPEKVGHSFTVDVLEMNRRPIHGPHSVDVVQRWVLNTPRGRILPQIDGSRPRRGQEKLKFTFCFFNKI